MRQLRRLQWSVMIGLLVALWPASSGAQANAVSWEVTAGFDGSFKAGAWFPLTIAITNTGPDIRGTLDVRFRTGGVSTYSQTIELPHSSHKRLVIPILSETNRDGSTPVDISLRSGGTVIRSERLDLEALVTMRLVVGVISDDSGALVELGNLRPNNDHGFGTTLLRLSGAMLPDRGELLQTFDVLFVHATDPSLWTEAQRAALQSWINTGGQLVVDGDSRIISGLGAALPVTTQGTAGTTRTRTLEQTGWRVRPNAPEQLPLTRLQLKPGAELVLQDDAGQPLLVRQQYGMGSVTVAGLSFEALRDVGDFASLWPRVLRLDGQRGSTMIQLRDQGYFTLQQSLQLPALRLPSILGFLGFLLLYIVTIGPLNYLLLRRLDRREWAYFTVPLLVILFSGGAYAWGTTGRGRAAVLSELSIVRVQHNGERGHATSLLALFSPSRHSYDLRFAPEALVADLQHSWDRQGAPPDILYAEDSTRVPELLVDVGAVRALGVEHTVPVPALEVISNAARTELTLRNRSDRTFDELMLVRADGRAQTVERLAPGEERTVELVLDRLSQDGFHAASGSVIDRRAALDQLGNVLLPGVWMGGPGFVEGVPPGAVPVPMPLEPTVVPPGAADVPDGPVAPVVQPDPAQELFVLGWQLQTLTQPTLDGQATTAAGETLFIWPVRKES